MTGFALSSGRPGKLLSTSPGQRSVLKAAPARQRVPRSGGLTCQPARSSTGDPNPPGAPSSTGGSAPESLPSQAAASPPAAPDWTAAPAGDSSPSPAAPAGAAAKEEPPAAASSPTPPNAPPQQPAIPRALWQRLLTQTVSKLATNLWPLLLVHLACDILVFGLHRASHRLTNEVALRLLGSSGVTAEAIGNLWWLSVDPGIANFKTGYQALTLAVFLLAFPLNVLLKATAAIYTVLICEGDLGSAVKQPWWRALLALRQSLPVVGALRERVAAVWGGVFQVELLVAAAVVPLQFASLAVVTLPLTLPFILDLQAAGAAAVLEGMRGIAAVKRSAQLVRPIRWRLAVPFVGLVAALRLMDAAKGFLLTHMPPRYYKELIEIPVGIVVLGTLGSLLITRLQDVLPYVAYKEAVALEQQAEQAQQAQQQTGQQHAQTG